MIQQNELILFICSVGILIFALSYRKYLWRVPGSRLVIAAYSFLVVGWALTLLEGLFWMTALNLAEHLCYAVASVTLAVWLARLPAGDEA